MMTDMTTSHDAGREALRDQIIGIIGRSYYDNEPGGTARTADAILAALATRPPAQAGAVSGEVDSLGEAMICTGCGTSRTIAAIKSSSATAFTCCPERKMIPAREMWDAWCAKKDATLATPGDTVAFVQHWLMNTDHAPSRFDRDFAAAIDARVIATSAKQLAETFCATPLPDDVCADQCATVQGPGRYGTNLLTVAQTEQMLAAAFATPAASGEIPAGMKPWHGGDSAPADWDGGPVLLRDGDMWHRKPSWKHIAAMKERDIIAYTPKASAETSKNDPRLADAVERFLTSLPYQDRHGDMHSENHRDDAFISDVVAFVEGWS